MSLLLALNAFLELLVVMRLWKTAQRAFAGFGVYMAISTVASLLLLTPLMLALNSQYRIIWIGSELVIALAQAAVSVEAGRNLKRVGKHLPDAITIFVAVSIMASIVAWGYSQYGYAYDAPLEWVFTIKASTEFFFCMILTCMLVSGHIPNRIKSLEFRHGVLLAMYFLLNSFTFFGIGYDCSIDRIQATLRPWSYFLLLTCTACLIGWLALFLRSPRPHHSASS